MSYMQVKFISDASSVANFIRLFLVNQPGNALPFSDVNMLVVLVGLCFCRIFLC